ncbi:MAG: flippase-like domain-containing protein [Pseudomonadota bacterium]|nr:flippase-like domain-containing protein [Pseudomonadota bacterium]
MKAVNCKGDVNSTDSHRRWTWTVVRVVASCAALIWVVHVTPLATVIGTLQGSRLPLVALGVLMNVATRVAAAERTLVMNQGLGLSVSRWQTLETLFISNFYALLSPGPWLSGAVSVYRYKSFGTSVTGGVSSLLASRGVEFVLIIVWGMVCALLDPRVPMASLRLPLWLAVLGLAAAVCGMAVWLIVHRAFKASGFERNGVVLWRHRVFAKAAEVWTQILAQGPGVALKASIPASIQALLSGAALMVLAHALQIDLSWTSGVWISAVVYAVVLLPISIAGLGIREITLVKCFALLGYAPRAAVAVSVLLFLDQLVSALIGGLLQIGSVIVRARQVSRF